MNLAKDKKTWNLMAVRSSVVHVLLRVTSTGDQ